MYASTLTCIMMCTFETASSDSLTPTLPLTDVDIISSGKHLLGEKPFGIDKVIAFASYIR